MLPKIIFLAFVISIVVVSEVPLPLLGQAPRGFLESGKRIPCRKGRSIKLTDFIPNADMHLQKCLSCECPDNFVDCSFSKGQALNCLSQVNKVNKSGKNDVAKMNITTGWAATVGQLSDRTSDAATNYSVLVLAQSPDGGRHQDHESTRPYLICSGFCSVGRISLIQVPTSIHVGQEFGGKRLNLQLNK